MKKWIIILILIVIAAIIGYNYIYQDHRDIESEAAEFSMSSSEIAEKFSNDAIAAEQKFLNKTIEISGNISEISAKEITLDDKIFCQFTEEIKSKNESNSAIKVKGRVIGYDDLLEQVKLDQCTIIN